MLPSLVAAASRSRGSDDMSVLEFVLIMGFALGMGAVAHALEERKRRDREKQRGNEPSELGDVAQGAWDAVDISVLRVAIDGRARRFIHTELARIADGANTTDAEGRLTYLRDVSVLLRRARDAWVYGGVTNEPMRDRTEAMLCFQDHVAEAQDKSHADGTGAHEGDDVILVSIIVAARTELFTVNVINPENLRQALEAAPHREPADLVAVRIVWLPSDDDDRVSTVELEAKYHPPALVPLWSSRIGKVYCMHCSGPFPAELVSCPHCAMPVHLR